MSGRHRDRTYVHLYPVATALGLRLSERIVDADPVSSSAESSPTSSKPLPRTKLSVVVTGLRPTAPPRIELGDALIGVGYKGEFMTSWQWSNTCGLTLEECFNVIREAKRLGNKIAVKLSRAREGALAPEDRSLLDALRRDRVQFDYRPLDHRTRGDQTPSWTNVTHEVRVGPRFQALDLPACAGTEDAAPGTEHEPEYSPYYLPAHVLEAYLSRVSEMFPVGSRYNSPLLNAEVCFPETLQDVALRRLTACRYDPDRAIRELEEDRAAVARLVSTRPLSPEDALKFERGLYSVGARDFNTVRQSMASEAPDDDAAGLATGDVVRHYYTSFKRTPAYYTWQRYLTKVKEKMRLESSSCATCTARKRMWTPQEVLAAAADDSTDAYSDSARCYSCRRSWHLECLENPRTFFSRMLGMKWKCPGCLHDPSGTHVPANSTLLHDTHASSRISHRRNAALALGENVQARSDDYEEDVNNPYSSGGAMMPNTSHDGLFGLPEDQTKRRRTEAAADPYSRSFARGTKRSGRDGRSHRPVRGPAPKATYDNKKRRLYHLKGELIDPRKFLRLVEEAGGYDKVVELKLWQTLRKHMGLPHTTSSSSQLRDAYLVYRKHAVQDGWMEPLPLSNAGQYDPRPVEITRLGSVYDDSGEIPVHEEDDDGPLPEMSEEEEALLEESFGEHDPDDDPGDMGDDDDDDDYIV